MSWDMYGIEFRTAGVIVCHNNILCSDGNLNEIEQFLMNPYKIKFHLYIFK